MSQLVTGEAVALDLRPAGLPSRVVAGLIDLSAQLLLGIGLFALLAAIATGSSAAAGGAYFIGGFTLIGLGYPVGFETLLRGRTPGKVAMGLRVVRDDGGPVSFRQALVRGLLGFFVERPGFTVGSAAVICALLNERGKRVGDLLAGTMVIQERVPAQAGPVAMMPPPLAGWAATLDLSALPEDLAMSVRTFLSRSSRLTDAARDDLGSRLTTAVLSVVTPPPPPGTPGWAVLSAVLAERRRREEARMGTALPKPWGPSPAYGPSPVVAPMPSAAPEVPPVPGPGGFVLPS